MLSLDGGEVTVHAVGGGAEFVDSASVDVVHVAGDFVVFTGERGGALPVHLEFGGCEVPVLRMVRMMPRMSTIMKAPRMTYQREKTRHTAKKMPNPLRKDFTGVPLRYGGVSVSVDFLH